MPFSSCCLDVGALYFFLCEAANLQRLFLASHVLQGKMRSVQAPGFKGPQEMEVVRHQCSSWDLMYCKAGEEIEALQDMRTSLSLANPCCTSAGMHCCSREEGVGKASLKAGVKEQHGTMRDHTCSHLPFAVKFFMA